MKTIKTLIKIIPALVLLPNITFAVGAFTDIRTILASFIDIINTVLVPLVFALAFLMFLWGMFVTFILGGSDEGKQSEGKALMLYSILAFVVMVCIWGIVNIIGNGFGLQGQTITLPIAPAS